MLHKRIIAWFSVLVIYFSIAPVVHADDEYISKNVTYWEQLMHVAVNYTSDLGPMGAAVKSIAARLEGDICSLSDDGYHYGTTLIGVSNSTDKYGRYMALAVCKYCNKQFNCYASDLQQSYDAQVSELPAPIFTSAGAYSWKIFPDKLYLIDHGVSDYNLAVLSDRVSFSGRFTSMKASVIRIHFCLTQPFYAPIDGIYSLSLCTLSCQNIDSIAPIQLTGSKGFYAGDVCLRQYLGAGSDSNSVFCAGLTESIASHKALNFDSFPIAFEGYALLSCVPTATSGDTYNINSRPTSITGDYGIIGDNGQITKVQTTNIVNETNNTYTNPATGETHTLSDWSYNYTDRSYTVTTETGDTVTITYGDENVVIKEGDTIYNIYYLVDGSGIPGPTVCNHQWTETGTTPATCTVPGSRSLACSLCNQTKTEPIPASGHTWTIRQTVTTEYDDEGNKTQDGYTIFECTVCGEQYKDMEGIGPPGPSIGDDIDDGGIIGFLNSLTQFLSENLHGVVDLILSFFREIPAMFSGFLAFLTAMFPFLPPEIMTLLTFGIAAVVFIGIIKAFRR